MLSACIWSNFDPHRIHIYNIVISPLVMSANVYLQNYLTHASYTLVYVVVIAFDVLADVIKIVNYTLIKCTIAKRLSSFEWFFFFWLGGGGYVNKNTSLLSLSLLDLIQHVYRCILELELPDLYILVTHLCTVRALMTLCRALRYFVTQLLPLVTCTCLLYIHKLQHPTIPWCKRLTVRTPVNYTSWWPRFISTAHFM